MLWLLHRTPPDLTSGIGQVQAAVVAVVEPDGDESVRLVTDVVNRAAMEAAGNRLSVVVVEEDLQLHPEGE